MNWYKKAANHTQDRVWGRLGEYAPAIAPHMPKLPLMYGDKDTAVCIYQIPMEEALAGYDQSNGDWIVAVIRKGKPATAMLRRSPYHQKPQPFTEEALRVERVVPFEQFQQDLEQYDENRKSQLKNQYNDINFDELKTRNIADILKERQQNQEVNLNT